MEFWKAFAMGAGALLALKILFRLGCRGFCRGGISTHHKGGSCCGPRAKSGELNSETVTTG